MQIKRSRAGRLLLALASLVALSVGCGAVDEQGNSPEEAQSGGQASGGGTGTGGDPTLQLGGSAGLGGDSGGYCWSAPHERTRFQGRSAPLCSR